jgi:polar amino acid transport system substrate-binding protein
MRDVKNQEDLQSEETMRIIAMAAVVAVAAMIGASHIANADALDDIKKAGKIRIAIDLGAPPYGMTDDKMQPTGLDVDTARLLAKDWGLQLEHVPTTGASRIPALQTGKADLVISSLSYTAPRSSISHWATPCCARSLLRRSRSTSNR